MRSFVIYFYIYQAFASEADDCAQKTIAVFLGVGALAGLYGTVQQVFNFHPGTYKFLQATGFLQAPMPYAGLMQMTSFLALGLLLKKGYCLLPRPLADQRIFAVIVLANFMGLFFACERSAWLGMAAAVLAVTLKQSPRAFFKVVAVFLCCHCPGLVLCRRCKKESVPWLIPRRMLGLAPD